MRPPVRLVSRPEGNAARQALEGRPEEGREAIRLRYVEGTAGLKKSRHGSRTPAGAVRVLLTRSLSRRKESWTVITAPRAGLIVERHLLCAVT